MNILTLNCGSSSVKYSLWKTPDYRKILSGIVERIGLEGSFVEHHTTRSPPVRLERPVSDHSEAISLLLELSEVYPAPRKHAIEIDAVAHRIVHGGEKLAHSTIIDEEVKAEISRCIELAPLHNPPNLVGLESAMKLLPQIPHIGVFDTAFFSTVPPHVYTYAIPKEWARSYRVRRFGFHGTSHLYVSRRTAVHLGRPPSEVNMITLHIGNGVSITAVKQGVAYDHSMGFTPLEGAVMGTRCGDIDPAIPLYLMRKLNLQPEEMLDALNRRSGLLGITGRYSDRRDILKGVDSGDEDCKLAFEIECYRLKKYIGAYTAALGEVDAITFTGGAGERSPRYREATCSGLEQLSIRIDRDRNNQALGNIESIISSDASKIKVYAIPTNEERVFVEDAAALLEGRYEPYWKYRYSFEYSLDPLD
ncbi:acetate kinase [Candidatus Bathyarchaeota archaeon]|nr:acetate kinase [Candidatus Bathyarchaeota archaeon]